jgi:hypothetical protein
MRSAYKRGGRIGAFRFCKGAFDHLHELDGIEELQFDEISEIIRDFLSADVIRDADKVIADLDCLSDALSHTLFVERVWALLLDSGIIYFLATQLSSAWPPVLLVTMLNCLSHILLYAPEDELRLIRERYPEHEFVQPLLEYSSWIDYDLRFPYILILSRLTRLYGTSAAALLEAAGRLACVLSDTTPGLITVEDVRDTLIEYLGQRYSGTNEASSLPRAFIQEYVKRGTCDDIKLLPDDALCSLFRGLASAVHHFPQWCESIYRASFQTIDQDIQQREVYPALRESLLNWIAGLAKFRPKPLNWNIDLLIYFGHPDSPDQGTRALEITTLIFTNLWDNHKRFPAGVFCEYCLAILGNTSLESQMALFGCVSAFLDHVARPRDHEVCAAFTDLFMPDFDAAMTEIDPLNGDLKRVAFQLVDSFIRYGLCSSEDFAESCWYTKRSISGDGGGRQISQQHEDTDAWEIPAMCADDDPDVEIVDSPGEVFSMDGASDRDTGRRGVSQPEECGNEDATSAEREHGEGDGFDEEESDGAEESGNEDENVMDEDGERRSTGAGNRNEEEEPGNEEEEPGNEEEAEEEEDKQGDELDHFASDRQRQENDSATMASDPAMELFPEDSSDDSEFDLDYIRLVNPFSDDE